mmetsp:Transcript_746/g.2889  ORF Transcript_746/g.2889 Transcript_746/m.2889 type:complete len:289 (-) Transcript_746:449-1315(-)
MVGGLVEEQARRLDEQGPGEGDAHAPATRERLGGVEHAESLGSRLGPILLCDGEPEAVENLARPRLRSGVVLLVELLVRLVQLVGEVEVVGGELGSLLPRSLHGEHAESAALGLRVVAELARGEGIGERSLALLVSILTALILRLGHPFHRRLELQLTFAEVHELDVRRDDRLERGSVVADNLLLHQQDVDKVGNRELAPGEKFHDGGLTHAVGTHEAVLPPVDDGHAGAVEELLTPRGDAEAVNLDVLGVGHELLSLVAEVGAPDGKRVVVLLHGLFLGDRLLARSL